MSLAGKIAVVTGGARGIGQAVATTLAREGADVVVADMEASRCEDTVNFIKQAGRKALALGVNVGEWDQVKGMADRIVQEWGRIDILVNNAGITRDGLLMRMKEEDWQAVLHVNLTGTFFCSKAILPTMSKQRSGRIVNITSIVGAIGNIGQANYAASKAAVIGLTKTVAREYAGRNVTVNAVAPGFIDTAMTQQLSPEIKEALLNQIPCKRLGQVSDVAEAVCFLSSDKAGYITGHVLHVNGGMHMA
ncbi:MAG: 3-oxoacyl-[acyl-carrier-protein] reductase [Nitrospirales bacterium]|nr:3-oxoacyl-[acyl-carrier-protein] reductase [Nitrospirales bacterium]